MTLKYNKKKMAQSHNLAILLAKLKGFTLSELLMSVLVVSIILVAMAPVITKRTSDNISVASVKTQGILFTPNAAETDECQSVLIGIIDKLPSTTCSFTIPDNIYSINAILVGAGGNGGSTDEIHKRHVVKTITYDMTNNGEYIFEPEEEGIIANFKILYAAGPGSGGSAAGGYGYEGEITKELCNSLGAFYFNNTCITTANVGDTAYGGAPIPDSVESKTSQNIACSESKNSMCCWKLNANAGTKTYRYNKVYNPSTGKWSGDDAVREVSYSGNYRTVCQFKAAENACNSYSTGATKQGNWRLPTKSEVKGWLQEGYGLMGYNLGDGYANMCSRLYDFGYPKCNNVYVTNYDNYNMPPGGKYSPAWYWYQANLNGDEGINPGVIEWRVKGESFGEIDNTYVNFVSKSDACSSRCVLGPSTYFSGAGGTAGGQIFNQSVQKMNTDLTNQDEFALKIRIAKGGSGGNDKKHAEPAATRGVCYYKDHTMVSLVKKENNTYQIYKNNDAIVYEVLLARGVIHDGNDGFIQSHSAAYNRALDCCGNTNYMYTAYNNSTVRYLYNQVNSNSQIFGSDGITSETKPTSTLQGGHGGGSAYESFVADERTKTYVGGLPGNDEDPNGQKGAYGAGGGGGAVKVNSDGSVTLGNGGDGGDGVVVISYDILYPPPVASGGGGGGAVIAKNMRVEPGKTVSVHPGAPNPDSFDFSSNYDSTLTYGNRFTSVRYSLTAYSATSGYGDADCSQDANGDYTCYKATEYDSNGCIATDWEEVPLSEAPIFKDRGCAHPDGGKVTGGLDESNYRILKGENGQFGTANDTRLFMRGGGRGGKSGISSLGGCGGYYNMGASLIISHDCIFNVTGSNAANGSDAPYKVPDDPSSYGNYGQAGAGGGGGGWRSDYIESFGQGGKGANGYVYIWWLKVE